MANDVTFGRTVAQKRKERGLNQKELAALIKRDDDRSISPQYLNDIEHDRRSPSSDRLISQFADVIGINPDYLYYLANRIPEDVRSLSLSSEEVSEIMKAFRSQSSKSGRR